MNFFDKKLLVLSVMLFHMQTLFATTMVLPDISEEKVLEEAHDVIEGVVVKVVTVPYIFFSSPCFDFIYEFRVSRSLKRQYHEGDMVSVGSWVMLGDVEVADRQLLILEKVTDAYRQHCSVGRLSRTYALNKLVRPYFPTTSVYHIVRMGDGSEMFNEVSCPQGHSSGGNMMLGMYKDFFGTQGYVPTNKVISGKECVVLQAPYKLLQQKIFDTKQGVSHAEQN